MSLLPNHCLALLETACSMPLVMQLKNPGKMPIRLTQTICLLKGASFRHEVISHRPLGRNIPDIMRIETDLVQALPVFFLQGVLWAKHRQVAQKDLQVAVHVACSPAVPYGSRYRESSNRHIPLSAVPALLSRQEKVRTCSGGATTGYLSLVPLSLT